MRWSAYLQAQPVQDAKAVVADLTVGYGTLAFMVRQLTRNGEVRAVVAALDHAEAALDRAYRCLAMVPERPAVPMPDVPPLGQLWQAYLTARPDADGGALLGRLQDVVAQAQVAGEVIAADGTVEEISIHLRAALDQLQGLRVTMDPAE